MTTSTIASIDIWIDALPPVELSKNGRVSHWSERNALYQQHKMLARSAINTLLPSGFTPWRGAVDVSIVWHQWHTGHWPDRDNTIERCAAYMDAAQETGLIVNDRQIRSFSLEYIKSHAEGVQVIFTHEDEAQS